MKTSEEADQVGQQTEPAQGMHGCLCWLRLLLSVHIRHERDVYKRKVFATDTELELSQRLYKRRRFDIANRSAELAIHVNKEEAREYIKSNTHLNYAEIRLFAGFVYRDLRYPFYPVLNGICDVRDDLAKDGLSSRFRLNQSWSSQFTCTVRPR